MPFLIQFICHISLFSAIQQYSNTVEEQYEQEKEATATAAVSVAESELAAVAEIVTEAAVAAAVKSADEGDLKTGCLHFLSGF